MNFTERKGMFSGKLVAITLCCLLMGKHSYSATPDTAKFIEIYFFLQPDCPISQQYTPVINAFYSKELHQEDIKKLEIIFSTNEGNQFEKKVKAFMTKYNLVIPYQIDQKYRTAKKLKAAVTPEVFLVVNGIITYHGAIDNMYAKLGVKRQETTEFYLKEALESIRNGLPLPYTYKEALGCFIEY